ncbi:MAG TPA: hypothetical protein VFR18_09820 [Terriglobia bacterium]|nr:hypothetical protein [Terriglobia bacterium]
MQNAHLRMGKLTFVRQTRDTITNITVPLNCLVAEPADPRAARTLHLVSVFGGDQDIGAVIAAAHEGLRFKLAFADQEIIGTLGEKPVIYRASLQIPERKRPVRHAVLLSKVFFETTFGANSEARRTVIYDDTPDFVLHRLAVRFGLPVLPEWAEWFSVELRRRGMVEELVGLNCDPIAVKGTKLRLLRILSQGLRRKAIAIPSEVPAVVASSRAVSNIA